MPRLGFLHTAQVHVDAFDALVGAAAPTVHLVEPRLLERARQEGATSALEADVRAALTELVTAGAAAVVCTCSTLGPVAEAVAEAAVPVLRIDRPMARRAVALGRRIGVVTAVESTVAPTRELLAEEAARAGVAPMIVEVCVPAAWERFESGDVEAYLAAIADAARSAAAGVDVVVLAQASMAGAVPLLDDLAVPVLASPRLAVEVALRMAGGALAADEVAPAHPVAGEQRA